jgi:hypothetical protein
VTRKGASWACDAGTNAGLRIDAGTQPFAAEFCLLMRVAHSLRDGRGLREAKMQNHQGQTCRKLMDIDAGLFV